jgi:hypothetical protein
MRRSAALAFLVLFLLAGTAGAQPFRRKVSTPGTPPVINAETQLLWNQYERAVYDSCVYQRWNLRKLRPLTIATDGTVKVATLTSSDGKIGDPITAGSGGIWVTGVPEVQTICQQWRGPAAVIEMRLRQLIGLPPDADTPRFLVLQAKVADVFRPAPYDAVDTYYPCAVDANGEPPADCGNVYPATTTPAHYQWMATNSFALHAVPDGYPWTHLGYTYNWAPGADRYGTSEYVIRPGASATIIDNVPSAQYCAPPPPPSQ